MVHAESSGPLTLLGIAAGLLSVLGCAGRERSAMRRLLQKILLLKPARRAIAATLAGAVGLAVMTTPLRAATSLETRHLAPHVSDDARMVAFGRALKDATTEHAVIATVWAGNIAYYAERPMVDLLGKSDRVVARSAPRIDSWRSVYPGHNKWDYTHSIGALRPDIVAQLWGPADDYTSQLRSAEYEVWCLERRRIHVLAASRNVDVSAMSRPVGESC